MAATDRIKVMLVDDHPIVRHGLREILERDSGFSVVGEAGDGEEAVREAAVSEPDVVVMDVLMPGKDGVEACREIMELLPQTRVLMLTASTQEDAVINAVAAGATGYLQKFTGKDEFLSAVREIALGGSRLPVDVVQRVFAALRQPSAHGEVAGIGVLTQREREILTLFSLGKSYAEIAKVRGNSPLTIRNAIYRIEDKLGYRTKQEIVVWAVRNGLLDDSHPDDEPAANATSPPSQVG